MLWMVFILVGLAWWNIDRAIRRWSEDILRRIDKLEACLARKIELHTAPDPKDFKSLGTLIEEARLKAKGE